MLNAEIWTERAEDLTRAARMAILTRLIGAVAERHAAGPAETRSLADIALARVLDRDPALRHFREIVEALRNELAREQEVLVARVVPEPPTRH